MKDEESHDVLLGWEYMGFSCGAVRRQLHTSRRQSLSFIAFATALALLGSVQFVQALTCPALESTIGPDESGEDVRALQAFLIEVDHLGEGNDTGYFGPLTQAAVETFQAKEGIVSSGAPSTTGFGLVGPRTRESIASACGDDALRTLGVGSSGTDVAALQTFLKEKGYYAYPEITGYFGPITKSALVAFQKASGIDPIGIAGPATHARIAALSSSGNPAPSTPTTPPSSSHSNTAACSAPPGLTCIPGTSIVVPRSPGPGYIPGFGGGGGGDSEAPTITLSGANPLSLERGSAFSDPGASATDNTDGSVSVVTSGTVDADTVGSYTVTYMATDAAGNIASETRTVTVVDTTDPSFSALSSGTPGTFSTTISWTTDEAANSRVAVGTSTSYGTIVSESDLVTSHSVEVDNLIAGETYHFLVSSTDGEGNVASTTDSTFTAGKFDTGAKVTAVGDSIIQYGHRALVSGAIENQADGEFAWARFRSPRFSHEIWFDDTNTADNDRMGIFGDTNGVATGDIYFSGANLGYAGDTATGILQRVDATINTTADIIVYSAGTNVGTTDTDPEVVTAAIESAVDSFREAGKGVILGTIRPRTVDENPSGSEINPGLMGRIIEINDWIRANADRIGAVLWDPWDDLRDLQYDENDTLYGTDAIGVTRDNVHLTPYGAWLSSESLAGALDSMIDDGAYFDTDPSVDNLLASGLFTGTGGNVGGGFEGTLPNSTSILNTLGDGQPVTGIVELEDNAETGGKTIVITATSTGTGTADTFNTVRLGFTNPTTGFTSTDYVSMFFEVEVDESEIRPSIQATLGQGSTLSSRGLGQVTSAYNTQPFATSSLGTGWIVTEPLLVGSRTALNPRFDISVRTDEVGTTTVKVKRAILRIVPDPTLAFPWNP